MWANASGVGAARGAGTGRAPARRPRSLAGAVSLVLSVTLLAWASPARAICRLVPGAPAPTMTFTGYSPLGPPVVATATIPYTCGPADFLATVSISTSRSMSGAGGTLAYQLFVDQERTVVFPGSPAQPISNAGGTITVYGALTPQDVRDGSYQQQLTVTFMTWGFLRYTTTLTVNTSFPPTCLIDGGTLAFGNYDPTAGTALPGAGSLALRCTRQSAYTAQLDGGTNAAGSTRRMAGPSGGLLAYELFSDPARTVPWDATSMVRDTAPSWDPITLTVYGRVPPGQYVPAGDYLDTVRATITF